MPTTVYVNDENAENRLSQKASAGGKFSSLLKGVVNEVKLEHDQAYAADTQVNEALVLINEWMQVTEDEALAQELEEALQEEMASQRRLELLQGESAAVKVAVEERRRLVAEAKTRKEMEMDDEKLAKKLAEDDEDEYACIRRKQEQDDEEHARALAALDDIISTATTNATDKIVNKSDLDEPEHKADFKDSFRSSSSNRFEDKHQAESKEQRRAPAEVKSYSPVASEEELNHDYITALRHQRAVDEEVEKEEKRRALQDMKYAQKVARLEQRRVFQAKKRRELEGRMCMDFSNIGCNGSDRRDEIMKELRTSQLWSRASAEIDDVQGAVCISLLLPDIKQLRVVLLTDGVTLRVEASRMVRNKDAVPVTSDNASYIAEFKLDGQNLKIKATDLQHEYCSTTGLLHIYVEDVALNNNSNSGADADCKSSASSLLRAKSSKFLSSLKSSFFRVLSKK